MQDLTPEQALTKQYQEEAAKARAEAEKYKTNIVSKMSSKLEEAKAAKLALAEQQKQEMEEAIR